MVKKTKQIDIFITFLKIGVFGFGGGAAAIPLFHKEAVDKHKWMTEDEFSDMLATMNTLPGPMQTKMAGYIGYRVTGILGTISGLLGIILPSLLLMIGFLGLITDYKDEQWVQGLSNGILPVVGVLMTLLTWQFFDKSCKSLGFKYSVILVILSFIILSILNLHPITMILPLLLLALFLPKDIFGNRKRTFVVYSVVIGLMIILTSLSKLEIGLPKVNFELANDSTFVNYIQIFIAFLIPGVIGYGGGPAMIGLFEYEITNRFDWSVEQFAEVVALGNALPGVTATKIAGYTGFYEGGLLGTIIGIFAMVAPSIILIIILMNLLRKYKDYPQVKRLSNFVRPTITVLLGLIAYKFFKESYIENNWLQTIIIAMISFLLLQKYKVHPIFVIFGALLYGALFAHFFG